MPRAIWKGTVSFGLVTIPVGLYSAVAPRDLAFHLLDSADNGPVHQLRVNASGEEVPWERVVKGYELDDGRWVVLDDDDFRQANVKATQTIDVVGAVCSDEVALQYFDTPYYLAPEPAGRKAYALLREALRRAGRVAVAQIVIRSRQHLCALVPEGDVLLLDVMRYSHELRDPADLDIPGPDLDELGVTDAEVALAEQLVATIESAWDPAAYHDTYRDDLLALIERKAAGEAISAPERPAAPPEATVVDIAELLKRSVEEARAAKASGE